MIRDITIGQYYPSDSGIHKLDPRVKIIGTIVFICSLFLGQNKELYFIATVCLMMIIKVSKVPFSYIIKGMKPILFLLVFTFCFNVFFTPGDIVLWEFSILSITQEGLVNASYMATRLLLLITASNLMTLTTTPNALTDGIERLLKPLEIIKVPVHEIAMMMAIALRFIPILIEEIDKIMKAQIARGANLDQGNVMERAKAMVPVLVPLFISSFRRAIDLAMAMEARCYNGGGGRTKMNPLKYNSKDKIAYGVFILYVVFIVFISNKL